jgi:hypothetical protein
MSIKFDALSRIIDEFADAIDSYGEMPATVRLSGWFANRRQF